VNELQGYLGPLLGWPWAYEKVRPKTHKLKEMGLTVKLWLNYSNLVKDWSKKIGLIANIDIFGCLCKIELQD